MTAHELAKQLLEGPDIPVVIVEYDEVIGDYITAANIVGELEAIDAHQFGDGNVFYKYDENAKHYTPEEKPFKVLRIG